MENMQTYTVDNVTYEQLKGMLEGNSNYSFIKQNIAVYTSDNNIVVITNGSEADSALNTIEIWPKILNTTDSLYTDLKKGELTFKLGEDSFRHKLK